MNWDNDTPGVISPAKCRRDRRMRQARKEHRWLIMLLCLPDEPKCAWCGRGWDETHLQIDHMDGRAKHENCRIMRGKRWDVRVRRYWMEYLTWVALRVLCKECNSKDGRRRQIEMEEEAKTLEEAPF